MQEVCCVRKPSATCHSNFMLSAKEAHQSDVYAELWRWSG